MRDIRYLADHVAQASRLRVKAASSPPVSGIRTETVLEPAAGTAALQLALAGQKKFGA